MNPSEWIKKNLCKALFRLFPLVVLASLSDAALLGAIRLFIEILKKTAGISLGFWLLGTVALVLLRWILSFLRGVSVEKTCRRLEAGFYLWFVRRLRTLSPNFFHVSENESRLMVAYDSVHVVSFSAESLMQALQAAFQLLIFLPVLFFISPALTVAVLLVVLPVVSLLQKKLHGMAPSVEGEMASRGKLRSDVESAKTYFRRWSSREELSRIGEELFARIRGVLSRGISVGRRKVSLSQGMEAISVLSVVLVLAFCGWMILNGRLDAEGLVLYCSALFLCYRPVKECARLLPQMRLAKSAQEALESLSREPSKKPGNYHAENTVEFADVGFSYGKFSPEKFVFKNLNLKISLSKPALLQGPNGCGKSTLMRLVAGLEEPCTGKVLLPQTLARRGIFFVSQDLVLPSRKWLCGRVAELFKTEPLFSFAKMLDGGRLLKKEGLSGGERAKVALLWALVSPSKILLLDEPFAFIALREREPILELFLECSESLGKWVMLATHEPLREDLKGRFEVLEFLGRGAVG